MSNSSRDVPDELTDSGSAYGGNASLGREIDAERSGADGRLAVPELPPQWVWTRVDEVGSVQLGRQRAPRYHTGAHMRPYLRVANVYEDRLDLSSVLEMDFGPDEYETYRLEPGDILLNEGQSLELVGRPAMFRGEVPGACFQNTLVRFRANQCVLPRYALIVFMGYLHTGRFQRIARWTTNIAHLGASRFAALEFPLPPFAEQCRIVAEIETQFARLDAGVAALKRVQANLKRCRAAVLRAACEGTLTRDWRAQNATDATGPDLLHLLLGEHGRTQTAIRTGKDREPGEDAPGSRHGKQGGVPCPDPTGLPELPSSWRWASLGLCSRRITDGTHNPPTFVEKGIPFIFVRHIVQGRIRFENTRYISKATFEQLNSRCPVEKGDILYSAVGSYGTAVPVETDRAFSFQRHIAHIKPSKLLCYQYLVHSLNSPICRSLAHQAARGVAQKTVTLGDLARFSIPLPPFREQQEIAAEVERRLSIIEEIEVMVAANLKRAERLRQAILKRAFEGKLVPQDPNDEPASELLQRIRAERAESGPARAKRSGGGRRGACGGGGARQGGLDLGV